MTTLDFTGKNVPVQTSRSVPNDEVVRIGCNRISKRSIEGIAVEKYKSCGLGITFEDLEVRFRVKKPRAQRSLKYYHAKEVLFTAEELISQGIDYLRNTNPQQYFPSCIRAEIIENLDKKNSVQVQPTGVNLTHAGLSQSSPSKRNNMESQKAQSFLDVLLHIPFAPLYIHKLQLMLHIDKEYYNQLPQSEAPINRAKGHEENIGRRHVKYTLSPSGTVEIDVRSSDTPFKLQTDYDELIIFSFIGQVRDRLLKLLSDPKERQVPPVMEWVLKQCDLNKDIEIIDKAQLTLPDIQLKTAAGVFRLYIKSLKDRAVCRAEQSLKVDALLPEALDNILHPYRSIENMICKILEIVERNEKYSLNGGIASATSNDVAGGQ